MGQIKSEQGLFDAAIESARIFNHVVAECAVSGGLLNVIREFSTAEDVISRLRIHSSKANQLIAMLDVLEYLNLIEQITYNGRKVYRSKMKVLAQNRAIDGGLKPYQPKYDVLGPWFGLEHVQRIRSANRQLLGEDLVFFRRPEVKIRFDREYLDAWQTNLLNPLYEFGRIIAVREIVQRGHYFLDLASGLGYGAQRLAEFSREPCEIVCIDRSRDMLAEARKLIYPGAKIRFIEWDLNNGLPSLPNRLFDGVLFNGAFHFIENKWACLREIYKIMRPGGLLVIGHCFCKSGFEDEPMHNLYFSLLENPIWIVTFEELRTRLSDAGFVEFRQYHRGSHRYLLSERKGNHPDSIRKS